MSTRRYWECCGGVLNWYYNIDILFPLFLITNTYNTELYYSPICYRWPFAFDLAYHMTFYGNQKNKNDTNQHTTTRCNRYQLHPFSWSKNTQSQKYWCLYPQKQNHHNYRSLWIGKVIFCLWYTLQRRTISLYWVTFFISQTVF